MSDLDTKTLMILTDEMSQFRAEMETIDKAAIRIASKTKRIISVVMGTLTVASVFLSFLVYAMTNYLSVMLGHLDDMYAEFGIMSDNMQVITQSVGNIGVNISGIPVIGDNMTSMSTDLGGMVDSVRDIKLEMVGMENNTAMLTVKTNEMAYRFNNLSRVTNHIGYNVNQLGRPMP